VRGHSHAAAACAADTLIYAVCDEYETCLHEERGVARSSIDALSWEVRHFLTWHLERCGAEGLMDLSVSDIDLYMDLRAVKLTRSSLKAVAERFRSLLRHLYRTGHIATDLSPHIIAPLLTPMKGCPQSRSRARSPWSWKARGRTRHRRDHATSRLLANCGLRSGEIRNLRINYIDWWGATLRVRHSNTQACSFLPLMEPMDEAIFAYLRSGRPVTDAREIFVCTRAPYRKLATEDLRAIALDVPSTEVIA